jgi:hypothetical protein
MILNEEQLQNHLGMSLDSILEESSSTSASKLQKLNQRTQQQYNLTLPDYLITTHHQQGKSLNAISKELNISFRYVQKLFSVLNFPKLTREESMERLNRDPEHLAKVREGIRNREYTQEQRKAISERAKKMWENEEYKKKMSKLKKKQWQDSNFRELVTEAIKKNWRENRQKMVESIQEAAQKPELRERRRQIAKELMSNPEARENLSNKAKKRWNNPNYKKIVTDAIREHHKDPEYRAQSSERMTLQWQDPDFREKVKSSNQNPILKKKRSTKSKKMWQDSAYRKKQLNSMKLKWQNPDYRERMSRIFSRIMKAKWSNPDSRAVYEVAIARLWQNPEFRAKHKEAMQQKWLDPEYREMMIEGNIKRWQNPIYRERTIRAISESATEYWNIPENREKRLRISRQLWADQDFRESMIEASKERWNDPEFRVKMSEKSRETWRRRGYEEFRNEHLPTHSGFRSDIGFNAKSAWEANVARALLYNGRIFETDVPLDLVVEGEYDEMFESGTMRLFIDFLAFNENSGIKAYEIVSHYFENPRGLAKVEMLMTQYPRLNVKLINERFYKKLRSRFRDRINSDSRFIAWEDSNYNITTNPSDFS